MLDLKQIEKDVREFWKKNNIEKKLLEKNKKGKNYFLLDGPPYANFTPHVGHIKNTVFKDILIRIALMKGKKVLFQPGFDTHGLPVENMVEQKLKLKSKKDIEKLGIEKFMNECKKSAVENKDLWMEAYEKLGSLYQGKEPYLTYENYYINSAWWAFSQMYKKGMVYEGEKPVMWCPHCETSLAGYEVTDSYKDVVDPGVYVLFKLKNSEDNLLVYTTTPWTLPANVAVAVASKEDYVKVDVMGKKVILAKNLLGKLSEKELGYKIEEEFKGEKLVGKKYEPLLKVPLQKKLESGKFGKAHEVIASVPMLKERVASKMRTKKGVEGNDVFEEFVTVDSGTGLVHCAPGHGKTDSVVGQHYGLASVSPLDDECNFTEDAGFKGFVKDADKDIIKTLEEEGKLLFEEKVKHSYPLCWRCKSPLIFRLSKQLFFRVNKVKDIILKENKKVLWHPEFARERFENWVDNAEDWNISRQRYWGIPIPIWKSEDGEEIVISDVKELEKLCGKKIKDLHVVENLSFEKSKKTFKKVKGILDVWFDSGVAPFASLGYPHKNKKLFEDNFPVSRINEAQDQIRGWFYSLMFCSVAVFGKRAYKEVSMTGWVLDKKGSKMSKSLGNVVTAKKALEEYGGDLIRYYYCWDVAPYETQKFNGDILKKEVGKILNVLWNMQNLSESGKIKIEDLSDEWILSKLESMTKKYLEKMDEFEFSEAFRELSDFILNSLSRQYVQMNRERGVIIGYCLSRILNLLAPVSLFVIEKIWQELRIRKIVENESVHLCDWPKANDKKINVNLENKFENVFKIIERGLYERDKNKIGLKWPLQKITVYSNLKENISELEDVIKNQLNVKEVVFENSDLKENELEVKLETEITEELETEGFARNIARGVQALRKKQGLIKENKINLIIFCGNEIALRLNDFEEFLKERTNSEGLEIVTKKRNLEGFIEEKIKIKEKEFEIFLKKIKD
jgi:isoleucyl-tRNA synthetase